MGEDELRTIKIPINERLKEIRTYYGYSQTYIAEKLGIKQSVYAGWELNIRLIPLKHLNNISNIYGLNIDYILGLSDVKKKTFLHSYDKDIISKRLKEIRYDYALKVNEFADAINVSQAAIYSYENKRRLIQTYVCYDIARKFNVSVDWLLGKSNNKELQ